jgi:hypothetical protein
MYRMAEQGVACTEVNVELNSKKQSKCHERKLSGLDV